MLYWFCKTSDILGQKNLPTKQIFWDRGSNKQFITLINNPRKKKRDKGTSTKNVREWVTSMIRYK